MNRIVIMGPPGSGKSTLAVRLGQRLGLPVHHLDQHYWRPGWNAAPADEFRAAVERLASTERWIIEGNYTGTIQPRFARAEAVIYLDVPARTSLRRVMVRSWRQRGKTRPDLPPDCPERIDPRFYWFVLNWNRRSRARNLALVDGFGGFKAVLRGMPDLDGLVSRLSLFQAPPCKG